MAFMVGPKKKRGALLLLASGGPDKEEDAKPDKSAEYSDDEDDAEEADEAETDESDGDFKAMADKAGVEDLPAFMKFLGEAIKRCK